jgi:aminoglycoside phosphotransferase
MKRDVAVLQWLHGKVPVAKVLFHSEEDGYEYLLTTEIEGEDATHSSFIEQPEEMVRILGQSLRKLHNIDIKNCPINVEFETRLADFRHKVQTNNGFEGIWIDSECCIPSDELVSTSLTLKISPEDRVFTHGDYCLPNIVIKDGNFSGFIDIGNAGIADRHYDIAWAFWSLNYNLGSRKWERLFLQSYGMEDVDYKKIRFYLAMDNCS